MSTYNNKLGRWQGAGLLATTLLGTGVFILPQMTISIAGQSSLISWFLLTIAIIPITLVFARLAAIYPHAAGPAYFVEQAFGKIAGRSIGIIFLLIVPLGVPAAILITITFIDAIHSVSGLSVLISEVIILSLLFCLNFRGIQLSAKLQFLLTLSIITTVLALISLSGFEYNNSLTSNQILQPDISLSPILSAAGIAFWSFLGVEAMTHLSNDFKDPRKDMIPAMLIGTGIVGIIYLACTFLLLQVVTDSTLSMIGAFDALFGGGGHIVIGILGIAGGLSSANVYTASTIRLVSSFSQAGILPKYLSKHNRYDIPENALLTLLFLMALVLFLSYFTGKNLENLIAWCNGVFVIIYLMTLLSAIKLLGKSHYLSIFLGCIFCLALAWGLGIQMLYGIISLSIVAPLLWWQHHYQLSKRASATFN